MEGKGEEGSALHPGFQWAGEIILAFGMDGWMDGALRARVWLDVGRQQCRHCCGVASNLDTARPASEVGLR